MSGDSLGWLFASIIVPVAAPNLALWLWSFVPHEGNTHWLMPVKDGQLIVTVTAEGRVMFSDEDVTGRVFESFSQNVRVQTERELYIRADKNARYGTVAEVVAAARRSGVDSLNLLVEPEGGDEEQDAEKGK